MNVLVIPEDFRKDQYILRPIVQALFAVVDRPRATVRVCQDPLLGGVSEALRWERQDEIIERYPQVDVFLLCVDRDGDAGRHGRLNALEQRAAGVLSPRRAFLGCCAQEELEVWLLAGIVDLPKDWRWAEIRAHRDPKEAYFEPLARQRGLSERVGNGRKPLGEQAGRNFARIQQLCPKVAALRERLAGVVAGA
ncbi:MAG: hypothetical protein ACP5NI_03975 [Acetobacteraceae bacterium]